MLPKPGKNLHQIASYRPISLLPVFSKILEKIIYDRLKPTIEKEKLIPDYQFGFRNKHSIMEQMHRLINEILLATKKKQHCTTLFMDIEKAFDKVNHGSLPRTIKKHVAAHDLEANSYHVVLLRSIDIVRILYIRAIAGRRGR